MASAPDRPLARGPALGFGALHFASAGVVAIGVFGGLPARYFPAPGVPSNQCSSGANVGLISAASFSNFMESFLP